MISQSEPGGASITSGAVRAAALWSTTFSPMITAWHVTTFGWLILAGTVLFGLCLLVPVRLRILAITALIGLIFLAANLAPESTAARFYGDTVIFEFVAGVILGRIYKSGIVFSAPTVVLALALGFAVLVFNDYRSFDLPRLITIGIPAAFIIFFATSKCHGNNHDEQYSLFHDLVLVIVIV